MLRFKDRDTFDNRENGFFKMIRRIDKLHPHAGIRGGLRVVHPYDLCVNGYLINLTNPYVKMPEEVAWQFVSYTSAAPDTFVLTARVKDSKRTIASKAN